MDTDSQYEAKQFIYFKESTNRLDAVNPSSGACGIGQSLPCEKLSSICTNWKVDYKCQDNFFTNYMAKRYGSWAKAKEFWQLMGWW